MSTLIQNKAGDSKLKFKGQLNKIGMVKTGQHLGFFGAVCLVWSPSMHFNSTSKTSEKNINKSIWWCKNHPCIVKYGKLKGS